jgi:hypothetical protein
MIQNAKEKEKKDVAGLSRDSQGKKKNRNNEMEVAILQGDARNTATMNNYNLRKSIGGEKKGAIVDELHNHVIQLLSAMSTLPSPLDDEDDDKTCTPPLSDHAELDSPARLLPRTDERRSDWGCMTDPPTYPRMRVRWKPFATHGSCAEACSRQRRRAGCACWNGSPPPPAMGVMGAFVAAGKTLRTRMLISSVISSRGMGEPLRQAT